MSGGGGGGGMGGGRHTQYRLTIEIEKGRNASFVGGGVAGRTGQGGGKGAGGWWGGGLT